MTTNLNSQQIDQYIHEMANNPENFALQVRKSVFLDQMPLWSVLYPLEKSTGIVGRASDFFSSASHVIREGTIPLYAHNNPQACGYTATAFIAQNMFGQKHVQHFLNFEQFMDGLQDAEPGVFHIGSDYLDHAITLIKYFENGSVKYRVVQSYVKQYTLKSFIQNHGNEFQYNSFLDLSVRFLRPLTTVLSKKGKFEEKEVLAFEQITKVREEQFLGQVIPPSGIDYGISRTTDTPQDDSRQRQNLSPVHAIATTTAVVVVAASAARFAWSKL